VKGYLINRVTGSRIAVGSNPTLSKTTHKLINRMLAISKQAIWL